MALVRRPTLVIVAGPNGAGKSTFVASGVLQRFLKTPEDTDEIEILNPDRIAAELRATKSEDADLTAAREVEARLGAAIEARRDVGIETVLSSDKYKVVVLRAKELGFRVLLVYVYLREASLHVGRVRYRTQLGGHAVPEDKIISRFARSTANFEWFARQSDVVFLFDNSYIGGPDGGPRLAAEKTSDGMWREFPTIEFAPDAVKTAVRNFLTQSGP